MTDKQIIVTFSDGYCIVLEDNKVSIREDEFTKLSIVVGNRTNELLEFVKNIYLDNKRKEQECEKLKEEIKHYKQIAQYHDNLSVKYTNKSAKFKHCLTEIKEIAENVQSFVGRINIEDDVFEQMEQILQKISECEV